MRKKRKLYIVTGGAGFIGSHLVERLINQKYEVIIIDDLSSGYKNNLPSAQADRLINKQIRDVSFEEIMNSDGIFHLAAQASVPFSIDNFFKSSQNNLVSTLNLFLISNLILVN